jgi:hypothetical protein
MAEADSAKSRIVMATAALGLESSGKLKTVDVKAIAPLVRAS